MSVSKTISFLIRSFLFMGVLMNTIYIPIHQSVRFINDDSFELVESSWKENQEEEEDEKRDKKEVEKVEYQIFHQRNILFLANSNSLFDIKSIIYYHFKLEIPFPPPDSIV